MAASPGLLHSEPVVEFSLCPAFLLRSATRAFGIDDGLDLAALFAALKELRAALCYAADRRHGQWLKLLLAPCGGLGVGPLDGSFLGLIGSGATLADVIERLFAALAAYMVLALLRALDRRGQRGTALEIRSAGFLEQGAKPEKAGERSGHIRARRQAR